MNDDFQELIEAVRRSPEYAEQVIRQWESDRKHDQRETRAQVDGLNSMIDKLRLENYKLRKLVKDAYWQGIWFPCNSSHEAKSAWDKWAAQHPILGVIHESFDQADPHG
jgi:hypothetical protein